MQLKFNIAIGKSRLDKKWQNKTITWESFVEKISETHRTAETVDEYLSFKKERQDEIKDIGGFVGGYLAGGRRLSNSVSTRSLLTFDADEATVDFWDKFCLQYEVTAALYSTHKHTEEKPRYRLIIPLEREVFVDEYVAIMRRIAGHVGIDAFDHTGYQPHRLMYWPSTSKDGVFVFKEQKGSLLSPDDILATYKNWQDVSEWPMATREKKVLGREAKKQGEPLEKPGLIGAFCRAYSIEDAIEKFLPDIYAKCDTDGRYTFVEGSTSAGVVAYDNKFIYSHHSTDPCCENLCNAFDMVRLHKFHLDDIDSEAPINKKPSFIAMCDLVSQDALVRQQLGESKLSEAKNVFAEVGVEVESDSFDWLKEMDVDRKGNYLLTINNIALILEHDPIFKDNIAFDEFKQQAIVKRKLPWRDVDNKNLISDNDFANIENYIEKIYKLSCGIKLHKGLSVIFEKHSFHPIVEYLDKLMWDGEERIESLLIDYLGAKDCAYVRQVTRKSLIACVARVMQPGIKFDNVLTLVGKEGQGKSALFDKLGGKWFTDSFNLQMLQSKEAYEQIQGVWIIEIGELSGMAKAEVERVKSFIAARQDNYRSPYARTTEQRQRQCVFFATTNDLTPLKSQTGNRRFWPVSTFETHPAKSVFKITQQQIDQIWAEATVAFKNKEKLFLTDELSEAAAKIQEDFTEENPLVELIKNYLSYKIPKNWYKMTKWEKTEFINTYDSQDKTNLVERTEISKYEIWEMVLGKKETIDTNGLKPIKQAMAKIDGWEKQTEHVYFGSSYPRHKGSYRKLFSLENILC